MEEETLWGADSGYCPREGCCNARGAARRGRRGFVLAADRAAVACSGCGARLVVCECCGALTDAAADRADAPGLCCRRCGFLNLLGAARTALSPALLRVQPLDPSVIVCLPSFFFLPPPSSSSSLSRGKTHTQTWLQERGVLDRDDSAAGPAAPKRARASAQPSAAPAAGAALFAPCHARMLRALYDDAGDGGDAAPCPPGVLAAVAAHAEHGAAVRAAQRDCARLRAALAALARHRAAPAVHAAHALAVACARRRLHARAAALAALAAPLRPHLPPVTRELRALANTLLAHPEPDAAAAAREKAFLLRLLYRSLAPLALVSIEADDVIFNSGLQRRARFHFSISSSMMICCFFVLLSSSLETGTTERATSGTETLLDG